MTCRQCGALCRGKRFVVDPLDEAFCKLPCALAFIRENGIQPVPGLICVVTPASGS